VGPEAHGARVRGDAVPGVDVGDVFSALADPTRRAVVRSLAERPGLTASHLAGELPMTRQAVAKHLHALSGAGLVQGRREGRETRYTLTPAPLAEAIEWMTSVGAEWDERLARLAQRATH
jgi:DNA-binding transcriptional ArsR family regulator